MCDSPDQGRPNIVPSAPVRLAFFLPEEFGLTGRSPESRALARNQGLTRPSSLGTIHCNGARDPRGPRCGGRRPGSSVQPLGRNSVPWTGRERFRPSAAGSGSRGPRIEGQPFSQPGPPRLPGGYRIRSLRPVPVPRRPVTKTGGRTRARSSFGLRTSGLKPTTNPGGRGWGPGPGRASTRTEAPNAGAGGQRWRDLFPMGVLICRVRS